MKGYAFKTIKGGKVFLIRCFTCLRENYIPAAPTGKCIWCGAKPKKKDVTIVGNTL